MLLLDKRYQIIEKRTHLVSFSWKVFHFLSLGGAITFSFLAAYFFRDLQHSFDNQCVLNAKLQFKQNEDCYEYAGPFPGNTSFHNPHTTWGAAGQCGYCEYVFLLASIIGIIMIAFLVILPRGGSEDTEIYSRSWRIVLPFTVLSAIVTIFVFTAYVTEKMGIDNFCRQFEGPLNKTTCDNGINMYTLIYFETEVNANFYIHQSLLFANATFIFWMFMLATLLFRLVRGADFHLIVYQMENIKNIDQDGTLTDSIESLNKVQADFESEIRDRESIKSDNSISTLPVTRV